MNADLTAKITLTLPKHVWAMLHKMLSEDFQPRFTAFQQLEMALHTAVEVGNVPAGENVSAGAENPAP
jgi:hypothetical protein